MNFELDYFVFAAEGIIPLVGIAGAWLANVLTFVARRTSFVALRGDQWIGDKAWQEYCVP